MNESFHQHKFLLVVAGPTAVGKTDVAIALAKHFNTEIISADSRQFYREMNIGTAVPTTKQLLEVAHHFIQHRSIHWPYDVSAFEHDALQKLSELFEARQLVVLTGGSGLFIDAVCNGLDDLPKINPELRERVKQMFEEEGLEGLKQRLLELDPHYFAIVDKQNPRRLQRALEVCYQSQKTYTSFRKNQSDSRNFNIIRIALQRDRAELIQRINERVDGMIDDGLLDEVKKLHSFKQLNALNTVGYKEIFDFMEGKCSFNQAIEQIRVNTRRYAKRQMTWFNKNANYKWFHPSDLSGMIDHVNQIRTNT